ncbi:MAG: ABC transporter ATP-binding protein [Thermodesulfobacteriota bacterium]|nr:ABC transporter ATP-binding protein [Thermodesulfobacteriota bacterium]
MFRVSVQNVRKEYKIYANPHDRLFEAVLRKPRHTVFRVLEDISFEVGIGRSLGVIGDNGAGKSTLLKLLAGTVQPSFGTIEMRGRVAALLELGAGFHPEFSGRQNIFLNASLLGISQGEIERKEEEIIAFSELDSFIDRPVRTYSSGMYVRLAFSIATMVDPDILIIDEALAVGDMSFQKKCIQRMNQFKEQGKTMLFCSHSMYHVQELCERVIWLENGRIRKFGPCDEVAAQYEAFCNEKKEAMDDSREKVSGSSAPDQDCRIISFAVTAPDGSEVTELNPETAVVLDMKVEICEDNQRPNFGFAVMTLEEEIVAASLTHYDDIKCGPYSRGDVLSVRYFMDSFPLRVGTFLLLGAVSEDTGLLWYDSRYLGPFTITAKKGMGRVAVKGKWEIQ